MNLPESVDILGKTYTIELNPRLIEHDDCTGKCLPHRCLIMVDPNQDPQQMRDTLLHEVMHGIWSEMGMNAGGVDLPGTDQEEPTVRRMATGTLEVLRANPKFTKCLTARTTK